MSQQINAWFNEKIKDKVTIFVQANGGVLDQTFMMGDEVANTIKFPVVTGTSTLYKLTGAIEPVPVNNPGLGIVQVTMDDFEGAEFWRTQDAYKSGAREQDTYAKLLAKAVRRKRDFIRLESIYAFHALDAGANITTTGTGVEVPDLLHFEKMRAELGSYGDDDDDDDVFCPIPQMWASQLKFYKEFSNTQWAGPEGTQWNQMQRFKMKTVQGVTYIICPDSYFRIPAAGQIETFMWRKSAMGANTVVNMENMSMTKREDLQGSPLQGKVGLSAAAIGIQAKGVRRAVLQKILAPVRGP
jgi:Phage capsid protein